MATKRKVGVAFGEENEPLQDEDMKELRKHKTDFLDLITIIETQKLVAITISNCNAMYNYAFLDAQVQRTRNMAKMAGDINNERESIFDNLTNIELIQRYRLDRDGIMFLDDILKDQLTPPTQRNNSLTSIEKILVCLRFLSTSLIQKNDADLHSISQPTVSRVIDQVISAICQQQAVRQFICFPTRADELRQIKEDFFQICGFPNIIGVIDGTHIRIQAPHDDEPAYVNRLGYHSINTQIVFDGQFKVRDVVARWPGSTHDSRILRGSGVYQLLSNGIGPGHNYLLGDSGYPCKQWLLTPYIHPVGRSQVQYNIAHKRTRSVVERGIGQLKRRFAILHNEIRMSPDKACKVIMSCAVLHNICKERLIPLFDEIQDNGNGNQDGNNYFGAQDGLRYRDRIANTYF